MKLVLIKFLVGGLAVLVSYIVSMVLPWKEFGGIFATFPAVFLVQCLSQACNLVIRWQCM